VKEERPAVFAVGGVQLAAYIVLVHLETPIISEEARATMDEGGDDDDQRGELHGDCQI